MCVIELEHCAARLPLLRINSPTQEREKKNTGSTKMTYSGIHNFRCRFDEIFLYGNVCADRAGHRVSRTALWRRDWRWRIKINPNAAVDSFTMQMLRHLSPARQTWCALVLVSIQTNVFLHYTVFDWTFKETAHLVLMKLALLQQWVPNYWMVGVQLGCKSQAG